MAVRDVGPGSAVVILTGPFAGCEVVGWAEGSDVIVVTKLFVVEGGSAEVVDVPKAPVNDVKTDETWLVISEVEVGVSDDRMELRSDVNEFSNPPPV